eukprot:m.73302 g.73302  ORF g.73302 m.73302 type:complete len:303 (-) comp14322_c0_seq2:155-1063(-)
MNRLRSLQLDARELDGWLVDLIWPKISSIFVRLAPSGQDPRQLKPLATAALKAAALLRWGMTFGQQIAGLSYTDSKSSRHRLSWGLLVCFGELLWMALHAFLERIQTSANQPWLSQLVVAVRVLDRVRLGAQAINAVRFLYTGHYLRLADRFFGRTLKSTVANPNPNGRLSAVLQLATWRAGLNTLKAAIQAFGLHRLHRWLRAIVASGDLALEPSPTALDPASPAPAATAPRNPSATPNTRRTNPAACVYCIMAPPCNVRVLPCQHLACHVCLLDNALKSSAAIVACPLCKGRTSELSSMS